MGAAPRHAPRQLIAEAGERSSAVARIVTAAAGAGAGPGF